MMSSSRQPVPITIIGGFLGAGKTSLLSHILKANHSKRMAVLVNDFGHINIDAELIVKIEGETISLTNGCICCTIRDDLMTEVIRLLNNIDAPEHIIIETSGVSDPALVAHTFQIPALQGIVQVDSVVCVVDGDQALSLDEQYRELAIRQIKVADLLVLNKMDLVNSMKRERLRAYVSQHAPDARMIETVDGCIPLNLILDTDSFSTSQLSSSAKSHEVQFQTWAYTSHLPFTFMAVRKAVEQLPKALYRIKGFMQIEGASEDQALFQSTGGRAWLRLGSPWRGQAKSTRLVFIGRRSLLDPIAINTLFNNCQKDFNRAALDSREQPVVIKNLSALTVLFG